MSKEMAVYAVCDSGILGAENRAYTAAVILAALMLPAVTLCSQQGPIMHYVTLATWVQNRAYTAALILPMLM
jgi:hypothetical protein